MSTTTSESTPVSATSDKNYKFWSQEAQDKKVAQARAAANWTGDKLSQGATATKDFSIAAAKATGNFMVEFHKQHKTSGIVFMLIVLTIFITAIVDISAVSANGYLKWDSSVTDVQAAHRDRSITFMTFAIALLLFMIVKEFNYAVVKLPGVGKFLAM